MRILLLLGIVLPFIYLGYLMTRLDIFLSGEGVENNINDVQSKTLVFGDTDLSKQVTNLLVNNGMQVFNTVEPLIFERELNFCRLISLSDNDVDNLIMCSIGRKIYKIEKILGLCNDMYCEKIFKKENISYIKGEKNAHKIYEMVMSDVEGDMSCKRKDD